MRHRRAIIRIGLTVALGLAVPPAIWANGAEFFVPAATDKVDLVYFGRVKDARTGRPIAVPPQLTILDGPTTLYMPFDGDKPGHFSSPDVGAALKDLTAGQDVSVKGLEIQVGAPGYKTVKLTKAPRKTQGRVEIDVYLEPEGTASGSENTAQTVGDRRNWTVWFGLAGGLGLVALAAVTRLRGRQVLRH